VSVAALAFGTWSARRKLAHAEASRRDLERSLKVLEEERHVLDLIASGATLKEVLARLTLAVEAIVPEATCCRRGKRGREGRRRGRPRSHNALYVEELAAGGRAGRRSDGSSLWSTPTSRSTKSNRRDKAPRLRSPWHAIARS